MKITHNITAMNAQRQLNITTSEQAKSSEKLASGYKINRAADDAAELSISEKMRRQIHGLSQASRNAQDGASMMQVADGAMNEISEMVQRTNELCVKAANETLTYTDRTYIQAEINQIMNEINHTINTTEFNEQKVLCGTSAVNSVMPSWTDLDPYALASGNQCSVYTDNSGIQHASAYVDFSNYSTTNRSDLYGTGFNFTCCTCDIHYSIQFAPGTTNSSSVNLGSDNAPYYTYTIGVDDCSTGEDLVNKIISTASTQPNGHFTKLTPDALNPAKLIIYDAREYPAIAAYGSRGLFRNGVYSGTGLFLQIGSETGDTMAIDLPNVANALSSMYLIDVTDADSARAGIEYCKNSLFNLNMERSRVGGYQNRLEHTIKNLDNVVENTASSESQIRDTDIPTDVVEHSTANILEHSGESMLAQANQSNQTVLSLLK